MQLLAAILLIWITWVGYAFVVTGLGAWRFLLFRVAMGQRRTLTDYVDSFWCGLATLFALLQFWHFVRPIDFTAHIVLTSLGLIGFLSLLPGMLRVVFSLPRRRLIYCTAALAVAAIWLADRATGANGEYDAGLYHIAAVKWSKLYHIVPGLANLHMRFGFSSTITLLSALMDQGAWAGNANHLVNGFFLMALVFLVIRAAARVIGSLRATVAAESNIAGHADWLLLFCGAFITDWGLDVQASSYSTDVGAAVVAIVAGVYLLRAFNSGQRKERALVSILLAAAAITAKASAVLLCAPMILVALYLNRRHWLPGFLGAAFLVGPWLVRQAILSGYPLYPMEAFALPVDWRMPLQKVQWLHRIFLDWARQMSYDDTRGNYQWVAKWFSGRLIPPATIWKCFIPAILGILALAYAALRRRLARGPVILLLCVLLAIAGWYAASPDPRYASQMFCLWMAGTLALAATGEGMRPGRVAFAVGGLLLALAPLFWGRGNWIGPAETGLFYPTTAGNVELLTDSPGLTPGLAVYVPVHVVRPDGSVEDRVWDAPLPNAPRSEIEVKEVTIPPLRLRTPGDLQGGFFRPE